VPAQSCLREDVVDGARPWAPHHIPPVGGASLLEVHERMRMVGVATDVDVLEADLDGVSETVGLAVVGQGGGIFG
jgi:hypothetical protein